MISSAWSATHFILLAGAVKWKERVGEEGVNSKIQTENTLALTGAGFFFENLPKPHSLSSPSRLFSLALVHQWHMPEPHSEHVYY
jgi:hypothetical protein